MICSCTLSLPLCLVHFSWNMQVLRRLMSHLGLKQGTRARWPGEHRAAAALQAQLMRAVSGDAGLSQLAGDAFRG